MEETAAACYYRVGVSSQACTLLPRGPGQPWGSSDLQQHQLYSLTEPKVAQIPGRVGCDTSSAKALSSGKKQHIEELFGFGRICFPHQAPTHCRATRAGSRPAQLPKNARADGGTRVGFLCSPHPHFPEQLFSWKKQSS